MAGAYGDNEPFVVPDIVKQFVVYFYRHIRERNLKEIESMYEVSFTKLSDRHFKTSPWPHVDTISDLVDQDHVFCLLYKELYFRHLYARGQPDLRQRCESWDNYCELFHVIVHGNINCVLPNMWLWDMIDEFIYQFQSFQQFRGKVTTKSPEEIEMLRKCEKAWDVLDVLNVLQAMVDGSHMTDELLPENASRLFQTEGYYPNQSNVLRMLGYFSLVGLTRVHCLVGDYQTALKVLRPINLYDRSHLFPSRIPGRNITLYYYACFSYMMLRRYVDAATCFNTILMYITRVKQYYERSSYFEQLLQKNEQLYAMLAVTVTLCPAAYKQLDEAVVNQLKDKYAEKMAKMGRGDESSLVVFEELFSYSCPKFITPAPPALDVSPLVNTFQEAYRNQLHLFLQEVRSCQTLPQLKQYLALYSSISLPKLARLMDVSESQLRGALMSLKSKSLGLQYREGLDMTQGVMVSSSDLDFIIDVDPATEQEMVVVQEAVHTRHYADFLARHIAKFEDIIRDLSASMGTAAIATQPSAATAAY